MEDKNFDKNEVEISVSTAHDGIVEIKTEKIDKRIMGELASCDKPKYTPLDCKKWLNDVHEHKRFDLGWVGQPFVEIKPKNIFQKWLNKLKNKFGIKNHAELHPKLKRIKEIMYRIEYMKTIVPLQKELNKLKFEYERTDLKERIKNIENRIASLNKLKE